MSPLSPRDVSPGGLFISLPAHFNPLAQPANLSPSPSPLLLSPTPGRVHITPLAPPLPFLAPFSRRAADFDRVFEVREDPEWRAGLFTRKALGANDVYLRIPWDLVMDCDKAIQSPFIGEALLR